MSDHSRPGLASHLRTSRLLSALATLGLAISVFSSPLIAQEVPSSIWKVDTGGHTVYIAGSVHLLRTDDFPLPSAYDEVYEDSSKVIFEIDMAVMNSIGAAMKMQQMGTYPPDDSLKNHLSEKTINLLDAYMQKRGMAPALFHRMKPGMIVMTLSALEAARMGARADLGIEMKYGARAQKDGKATGGLETMEYQMGLFNDFTDEELDDLLRSTLESLDEMGDGLDKMINAWRKGDSEALNNFMNEEFGENTKLRDALLIQRNKNWMPEIEKAIKGTENILFIVGAGHLVGEDGVIDLLEKAGHKPVQLSSPPSGPEAKKKTP